MRILVARCRCLVVSGKAAALKMICFRISVAFLTLVIVASSFAENNVTEPVDPIDKPVTAGRIFKTIGVALGVTIGVTFLFILAIRFLLCCFGFGINGTVL